MRPQYLLLAVLYSAVVDASCAPAPVSKHESPPQQAAEALPATPIGNVAKSIVVRGRTLRLGDAADRVFETLKPADMKLNQVGPDPANAGSLIVRKHYEVNGKSFSLTFRRDNGVDVGAYKVVQIYVIPEETPKSSAKVIATVPATPSSTSHSSTEVEVLDCYALSQYGKARGDNFFVVAETVGNAERTGRCTWKERD